MTWEDEGAPATVIVRVLPEFRRRGFGKEIYARALRQAEALGADEIETIVWASNLEARSVGICSPTAGFGATYLVTISGGALK